MKITQLTPPTELEAVRGIWKVELDVRNARYGYYYLPDNYSEILVVLRGSFERLVIGTRQKAFLEENKCYLAPPRSKGTILYASTDTTFLVLKLQPNLHNAIIPTKEFQSRNDVQEVDLWDYIDDDWHRAMAVANDTHLLEALYFFLEDRYRLSRSADPVVNESIEIIKERKGQIKVKDLNAMVGVCKSTLEEKFNKEVGLSPKEFCKIEKINYFLSNHEKYQEEMTLTQLTFKTGYYDQSHLIKEFRYFLDLSPRKYFREVNRLEIRPVFRPSFAMVGS